MKIDPRNFDLPFDGVEGKLVIFPNFEASLGISHSVFVPFDKRNKGLGSKAHAYRLGVAKYLGFKNLICTAKVHNEAQIKILKKFGWLEVFRFGTYCSEVILFVKNLDNVSPIPIEKYPQNRLREKELDR